MLFLAGKLDNYCKSDVTVFACYKITQGTEEEGGAIQLLCQVKGVMGGGKDR